MDLHTFAQRNGVTVIALAQLSRPDKMQETERPPSMASLRESGQIEQDADVVMLLYLENAASPGGDRKLRVAKNKEGGTGVLTLGFAGMYQAFVEKTESAEPPRRGDKYAASCDRESAKRSYWHSETEELSTRPRGERGVTESAVQRGENGGAYDKQTGGAAAAAGSHAARGNGEAVGDAQLSFGTGQGNENGGDGAAARAAYREESQSR